MDSVRLCRSSSNSALCSHRFRCRILVGTLFVLDTTHSIMYALSSQLQTASAFSFLIHFPSAIHAAWELFAINFANPSILATMGAWLLSISRTHLSQR
jgi:hypothetical protein